MKKTDWKPLPNKYKIPQISLTFLKKDILKAIGKSCISHGSFFSNLVNTDPKFYKMVTGVGRCIEHKHLFTLAKNCEMDIIGAILVHCILNRKARGIDGNAIGYALGIQGSIYHSSKDFLSNKKYLSALNTFFEKIDRDSQLSKGKVKVLVLEYIKKNFPVRFSMKISSEYNQFLKGFK